MKKRLRFAGYLAAMFIAMGATAQNNGGIDAQMLKELTESYKPTAAEEALRNILLGNNVNSMALNQENQNEMDTYFSIT